MPMVSAAANRRRVLAGLAALAAPVPVFAGPMDDAFAEVEARLGGRLGVCAGRLGQAPLIGRRQDERFAMASSFKWLLAAAVLERVDQGRERLDRRIPYGRSALIGHSPVTTAHLQEGALPIEALAQAVVEESDNGAANLLLASLGGPEALTAFLRRRGDATTRLDRNEPELNTAIPDDPRDTTTPRAMWRDLARLLFGPGLPAPARERLKDWMIHCHTGDGRIRAGAPKAAVVGDKTGTGERGAIGDVGFILPCDRGPPLILAVYLQAPMATPEARDAAVARCSAIACRMLHACG